MVPAEVRDIERRPGVRLQRLGRTEGADRGGQVVVPRACVGVVFRLVERVIRQKLQIGFCFKQRNPIDAAPFIGDMIFEPPAEATGHIQLPL